MSLIKIILIIVFFWFFKMLYYFFSNIKVSNHNKVNSKYKNETIQDAEFEDIEE